MSIPLFQPQVFKSSSKLPKNAVPVTTGLPVFVVSNRLGTKGYTPSGGESYWGVKNTQWHQEKKLKPNEVASNLADHNPSHGYFAEDNHQQHFFIPSTTKPLRYAGVDYRGQYPNIRIGPQFLVFPRKSAIPLIAQADLKTTACPLHKITPCWNDSRFIWYGTFDQPLPALKHGETMSLQDWQKEGYQPLPEESASHLTAKQVVPISDSHGLPVGKNPAKASITHYCSKRQAYCTSLNHVAPLPHHLRAAYGLPGHLGDISTAHWWPSYHEDVFEVSLAQLIHSDIVLHRCRISSNVETASFNLKKDVQRLPSSPITGTTSRRKTHVCARRFDPHHYQSVSGKANPDAEVWWCEGSQAGSLRRQHVLPSALGLARVKYQTQIKPTLQKFRKMFPQIQSPDLSKPQDVQDYITGCKLLEEGKAVHIHPYHELHDLFSPWETGVKRFHILPLPAKPTPSKIPASYLYLLASSDTRWLQTLRQATQAMDEPNRSIYTQLSKSLEENKKRQ
jgi:hypothetical protein